VAPRNNREKRLYELWRRIVEIAGKPNEINHRMTREMACGQAPAIAHPQRCKQLPYGGRLIPFCTADAKMTSFLLAAFGSRQN